MSFFEKHNGKVLIAYFMSVFVSGLFSKIPLVLDMIDVLALTTLGAWIAYLLHALSRESMRFMVLVSHVLVGALLHPAITVKESTIPKAESQVDMLIKLHHSDNTLADKLNLALDLSKMIKDEALFTLMYSEPLLYWVYPITAVLWLWGLVFFVLLSTTRSDRLR